MEPWHKEANSQLSARANSKITQPDVAPSFYKGTRMCQALVSLTRLTASPGAQNHWDEVTETAFRFLFQGTCIVQFQSRGQKYHNQGLKTGKVI